MNTKKQIIKNDKKHLKAFNQAFNKHLLKEFNDFVKSLENNNQHYLNF